MMKYFVCILLAYLIGSLSPSALISKLKHKDIRKSGTGNLGATNTMLSFGKMLGFLVMILDILKGFLAFKMLVWIAPEIKWLPMLAGVVAVIGHCFPFYLKFKGGKGLATFGGIVLAYNPILFICLLTSAVVLLLIVNHSFIMPFYAGVAFTTFVAIIETNWFLILFAALASIVLIAKHFSNLMKAIRGEDVKIRDYLKKQFQKIAVR